MSLNLNIPTTNQDLSPKITVIGVGGAGGNAVNNMIQSKLSGVEFLITNTDAQALQQNVCDRHIQLGRNTTQGLGAGSRPDIGRAAAEEAIDDILAELEGSHMAFVTAGMGGGTGTGAAPVIARAAREAGILTVGVVTKPFHFEGVHRMRLAEAGINELTQYVDTLIIIPNQNLFRVANEKTTFADAFKMADDVLDSGVRGVTDLMVNPGLINLDFADIRSVMSEMGKAMMGTGEAEGENRALEAAEAAISNPLLDDVSMKGARGVLINITGGMDMTLFEVDEAANRIRDEVDPEANIIFGSTFGENLDGMMRVSVVATGIEADAFAAPRPVSLSVVTGSSSGKTVETPPPPRQPVGNAGLFASSGATAQAVSFEQEESEPVMESGLAEEIAMEPAEPEFAETLREPVRQDIEQFADDRADELDMPQRTASFDRPDDRDSFFAPPPAEPEPDESGQDLLAPEADPFAEADLANASSAAEPRKRGIGSAQSLFARVTGALQAATHPAETAENLPKPQSGIARQEAEQRRSEPAMPRPPRSAAQMDEPARPAGQPRLTGLDVRERIGGSEAEEDLLDIPAFLRRQAN